MDIRRHWISDVTGYQRWTLKWMKSNFVKSLPNLPLVVCPCYTRILTFVPLLGRLVFSSWTLRLSCCGRAVLSWKWRIMAKCRAGKQKCPALKRDPRKPVLALEPFGWKRISFANLLLPVGAHVNLHLGALVHPFKRSGGSLCLAGLIRFSHYKHCCAILHHIIIMFEYNCIISL